MKKEPMDYGAEILFWAFIPFIRITEKSAYKSLRILGVILTFLFLPVELIAAGVVLPIVIVLMVAQIFYDC